MRLIRDDGPYQAAQRPYRVKVRKSKRAFSGIVPAAYDAREGLVLRGQSYTAGDEPRAKKPRKRVASAGGRQYRKSIDRIVNSPAKKMPARDVFSLTPTYPRYQRGFGKPALFHSAKSLLLPKKRVLVSPFRKNARKGVATGRVSNKRARSAFGETQKPQSRRCVLEFSLQKKRQRRLSNTLYRQQQATIHRLHMTGAKTRSHTGLRPLKALAVKRGSFLSLDRVGPTT